MFNPFWFRKVAAVVMSGMLCAVLFFCGLLFQKTVWWAVCWLALGLILSVLAANYFFFKNPWQDMLEGSGTMFLNVDSTGIIYQFVLGLKQNEIDSGMSFFGKFGNKIISDPFDRNAALRMSEPIMVPNAMTQKDDGGIHIDLSAEQLQKARLGMNTYTVLLYNGMIGQIIDKEWLSKQEKGSGIIHALNHLNQELKVHSFRIHDYARGVVQSLMPQSGFKSNWLIWVIGGIAFVGVVFFGFKLFPMIKGAVAPAAQSAQQAGQGFQTLPTPVAGST